MSSEGDMEPTIWLVGADNKHMPALSEYLWVSKGQIVMKYVAYFGIWWLVASGYHGRYKGEQAGLLFGFLTGLVLLVANDYLDLYAPDVLVNKADGKYYYLSDQAPTRVVFKDDFYKFDKVHAVLVTHAEYKRLAKEKNLESMSLTKYYKQKYMKTFGEASVENPLGGLDITNLILNGGSYLFSFLITLSMVAARADIKLFKKIFPFVILSGLFSVALIDTWFIQYNYTTMLKIIQLKTRALITAISFGVTACLILLFNKY